MINYREASVSDVSTIVDFQIAMARETEELDLDRDVCTRGVQAVFEDASRGRYFLAESDGVVIASLMITYEWSDWRNGNVWWIQSVYVVPEFRGQRVYAGLYEHVRASCTPTIRCAESGCTSIAATFARRRCTRGWG